MVVAGGREPAQWEAYPHHQFISTNGALRCCEQGGCWKSRCQPRSKESTDFMPQINVADSVTSKWLVRIDLDGSRRLQWRAGWAKRRKSKARWRATGEQCRPRVVEAPSTPSALIRDPSPERVTARRYRAAV